VTGPDGLVRCDACGHAFPPGGNFLSYSSGSFGAPPKAMNAGPTANYGSYPANFGNAGQTYPPASGPQNPTGPGMFTCAVVVGLGALALSCCGCFGAFWLVSFQAKPVAPPGFNQPFNPPVINPPNIPEQAFGQPPFDVPPIVQPPGIPGTPAAQGELDRILTSLRNANAQDFSTQRFLHELQPLPVEESRRREVVEVVLKYLEQANPLAAGPAQQVLEKWATQSEANLLAKFAAGNFDRFNRRAALSVLAKTGGDAETAKTIAPLLKDVVLRLSTTEALQAIGPDAEDAMLAQLDDSDFHLRIQSYRLLGGMGGQKSAERLREIANKKGGSDSAVARRALAEIEQRLREEDNK
jgi:hypothetical protein